MSDHASARLPDLRRFCTRGIYLKNGELVADGGLDETIKMYNEDLAQQ